MKYFILFLAICLGVNAQTKPRTWEQRIQQGESLINASVSVGYSSYSGSLIYLSPRYQYFFIDGLAIGADVGFYKSNITSRLSSGPSLTYYLPVMAGVTYLGQQISFVDQTRKITPVSGVPYDEKLNGSLSETSFGVIYPLTVNFMIDIGIDYVKALREERLVDHEVETHLIFAFYL